MEAIEKKIIYKSLKIPQAWGDTIQFDWYYLCDAGTKYSEDGKPIEGMSVWMRITMTNTQSCSYTEQNIAMVDFETFANTVAKAAAQ